MSLVDRLGADSAPDVDDSLNAHIVIAGLVLQARGHVTRAAALSALGIQSADEAEWDAIQAWVTTGNAATQLTRLLTLDAITTGLEQRYITKAQARSFLQAEGAAV